MPYCSRCGVELDALVRHCPLCSTPVQVLDGLAPGEPSWPGRGTEPEDPSKTYISPAQWGNRAFLTVVAFLLTAAAAVFATDLVVSGAVTWSRWPLVSLWSALLYAAAVFLWHHRTGALALAGGAITAVLLLALDACDDGRLGWSLALGLPVTALTLALAAAGAVSLRRSRRRGYNVFALVPALVALELVGIDAAVSAWLVGAPHLGWSVITSLVLAPLALLFLFLHYALHRTPDLKRIFHF